jgi:hypothetical protein
VDELRLPVAWGRLVSTDDDPEASPSPSSWAMDLETISYTRLPTQEYIVRITLLDGRTLSGEAVLESTNGRVYHFESLTEPTGDEELQPVKG